MEIKETVRLVFRERSLALFMISIVLFMIGLAMSAYTDITSFNVFLPGMSMLLISLAIFSASFLFFGYLNPLMSFLGGQYIGLMIKNSNITIQKVYIAIVSILFVSYASIRLGNSLLRDMAGKGNFLKVLKISIILLMTGLLFALVGDFLLM